MVSAGMRKGNSKNKFIVSLFLSPQAHHAFKWPAKCCNYFEKDAMFTPSHTSEWESVTCAKIFT